MKDLRSYSIVPSHEVLVGRSGDSLAWDGQNFCPRFATKLVEEFSDKIGKSAPFKWLASYLADPDSAGFSGGNYLGFDLDGNLYTLGDNKVLEKYLPFDAKEALEDCLCLLSLAQKAVAA